MENDHVLAARLRLMEYSLNHSINELLRATIDEAEILTGSCIGFYHFMDYDKQELTLQAWSTKTAMIFCKADGSGSHYPISQAGVWVDCVHENQPVIHNDYASLPHRKGMPEGHAAVIRELVVPVFRDDKIVAILGVGNKATEYDRTDVEAVTLLADLAWGVVEHKLSDNALKKSQRLLAETEKIGKVGGWEFDIDTGKQTWTGEIYAIHEVDSSYEPTVEKGMDFYTPASRPVIERAVQRTIEYGEAFNVELDIITARGSIKSVHVIGKADLENRRIYGFLQDITERKRTETYREMVREVLQILNEPGNLESLIPGVLNALKMRTGFDAVGIRLQKGDDFPYIVQEGFSKEFLLAENSLIERSVDGGICRDKAGNVCLECTCGLVISGKSDPANSLFTKGGSFWTNDSFLLLDLPPDMDPRLHPRNECIHQGYASVALVPIRDVERIVGLIQFNERCRDAFTLDTIERLEEIATFIGVVITRKRIEEEKQLLEQQLHHVQKMESLGMMSGGIAHNFNNILAVIICGCSLGMQRPEMAEYLFPEIEAAAERAAELCRLMLAYSGKMKIKEFHVDVTTLLDDMLNTLKSTLPQNVTVKRYLEDDLPYINGDVDQLKQVVVDLITNASEAIGEAQGEIVVSLTNTTVVAGQSDKDCFGKIIPAGLYLCLEVDDNGCGMNDETKQRIFEPFYTTKFVGRGLGLSAVLGIVTSHKGTLQLSSQPGIGTTFKVYLPIRTEDVAVIPIKHSAPTHWRGIGTILLVDDEPLLLTVAKSLLETLGFSVIEASNGIEALEQYRRNMKEITLVMTDIGMPLMDGYELIAELKKLDPSLPIIVSSGFGDTVVTSKIAPAGDISGLISKPYSYDRLQSVLKYVVEAMSEQAR